jgi:hypothetical protein
MKNGYLSFLVACFVLGCGQKSDDHHREEVGDALETGGNQALYDEVMKIHDEVMPRMDDIYRKKEELKNKIANTPTITDSERKEIEGDIAQLDSASEGMMVWMRQFNPLPDSLGEEKAREYLENEMEKIKKVREDIAQVLAPEQQ